MNLYSKQRRKVTQKTIFNVLISPNNHFISFANEKGNIFVYSTKNLKQLFKLMTTSNRHLFSPSSRYLAVGNQKNQLQVVSLGFQITIYNQIFSDNQNASIQYMKFQNENTLLIASFDTSQIFMIDFINQITTFIMLMNIHQPTFDYDSAKEIFIFIERNSDQVQIWSSKNEQLIFKSQRLANIPNEIKFLNNNLVLFNFYYYYVIYDIDYQKQEVRNIDYQIPSFVYGQSETSVFSDLIIQIVAHSRDTPKLKTIIFNRIDCQNSITKNFQIPIDNAIIRSLGNEKQIYLTIIAYLGNNTHFLLIRCSKM